MSALADHETADGDLRELARRHIAIIVKPDVMRMRRMVIGEADRFPELARAWAQEGIQRELEELAERLGELTRRGLLRAEDPVIAAQHFNWLVLSIPMNRAMFDPDADFAKEELDHFADEGIRVFLAA